LEVDRKLVYDVHQTMEHPPLLQYITAGCSQGISRKAPASRACQASLLSWLTAYGPRPPELAQCAALKAQSRQAGVVDVGAHLLYDLPLLVAQVAQWL
jgi:hypothetical protein